MSAATSHRRTSALRTRTDDWAHPLDGDGVLLALLRYVVQMQRSVRPSGATSAAAAAAVTRKAKVAPTAPYDVPISPHPSTGRGGSRRDTMARPLSARPAARRPSTTTGTLTPRRGSLMTEAPPRRRMSIAVSDAAEAPGSQDVPVSPSPRPTAAPVEDVSDSRRHAVLDAVPRVPDTVVYDRNFPQGWYRFHARDCELAPLPGKLLDPHVILSHFSRVEPGSGGICAQFVTSVMDAPQHGDDTLASTLTLSGAGVPGSAAAGEASGDAAAGATETPRLSVQYLTPAALEDLVFGRGAQADVAKRGLLQKFIVPRTGQNDTMECVWSPHIGFVRRLRNGTLLDARTRTDARAKAATFDGPPHFSAVSPTTGNVESDCLRMVAALSAHLLRREHRTVSRMVAHLKQDRKGRLWFLYATSMRVDVVAMAQQRCRVPLTLSASHNFTPTLRAEKGSDASAITDAMGLSVTLEPTVPHSRPVSPSHGLNTPGSFRVTRPRSPSPSRRLRPPREAPPASPRLQLLQCHRATVEAALPYSGSPVQPSFVSQIGATPIGSASNNASAFFSPSPPRRDSNTSSSHLRSVVFASPPAAQSSNRSPAHTPATTPRAPQQRARGVVRTGSGTLAAGLAAPRTLSFISNAGQSLAEPPQEAPPPEPPRVDTAALKELRGCVNTALYALYNARLPPAAVRTLSRRSSQSSEPSGTSTVVLSAAVRTLLGREREAVLMRDILGFSSVDDTDIGDKPSQATTRTYAAPEAEASLSPRSRSSLARRPSLVAAATNAVARRQVRPVPLVAAECEAYVRRVEAGLHSSPDLGLTFNESIVDQE